VSPRRLIAHLDLDAFYASVELLRHPALRGEPVVIGGRSAAPRADADGPPQWRRLREYAGRGVITTATYPARAFGLHSGMGLMKAAALAPDAILLPADFDTYRRVSREFKAAVLTVVPAFEDRGIDEIYLDLTDHPGAQVDQGRSVALALKSAVKASTGLTCSIAVAPNKLLAKIGSDLDKPDGLTLLSMDDVPTRIWPLPARRINGIGPKAAARLESLGIHSIGELAAADPLQLVEHFGPSTGRWMHEAAHGRDDRPLVIDREPKSISRETTFAQDLHAVRDRDALGGILTRLCEQLEADLARKRVRAHRIGIKVRYADFRIVTRDLSIEVPVGDAARIRLAAGRCLRRVDLGPRLRLLGVRASALAPVDPAGSAPAGPGGSGRAAATPTDALRQAELPLFEG
jgi:DNA polymerase-4